MAPPLTVPVHVNLPKLPWLSKVDFYLKIAEFFFTLIVIFCIIPVIVIESKYEGIGAAGPSWTLTVAVLSLTFPFMMAFFPYMYDKHDKFKTGAKVFGKARTNMILTVFWSLMWFTVVVTITVHTLKHENCYWNEDAKPGSLIYEFGSTYAHDWDSQCYAAKAGAGFAWLNWLAWLVTMLIGLKTYYEEKTLKAQAIPIESQEKASAIGRNKINQTHGEEAASYRTPPPQNQDTQPNDDEEEQVAMGRINSSFEQSRPLTQPLLPSTAFGGSPIPEPAHTHYGSPVPSAAYYSPPPEHTPAHSFNHIAMPTPQAVHPEVPLSTAVAMPDHQTYVAQATYVPPPAQYGYAGSPPPPQQHGYVPAEKEHYGDRY
ncbi:hypothetical protein BC936DRAFT_144824 [Jimgerdemannia flammicorona]|uniref:MARVEL domain-containing protein n=1 Tax=Jimgerdemannia flammicorona TaxID=994334 RepID=A0A433DBL9_9FUNG|nr:hypothetical protein BC936DRAFT_144824 [Jimgerdemannia flammicorona]